MNPPGGGHTELASLPRDILIAMREAAGEVLTCQHALAKTGHTVITEITGGRAGSIAPWVHYPPGDVHDPEYQAQFYFHVHPDAQPGSGEFGHFHLFLRREGMPASLTPLGRDGDGLCHLIALSVDHGGRPIGLFTTNRWVTNETWFGASDVAAMVDRFAIEHAQPSWPVNRWLTAMVRLYRPEIGGLLRRRDEALAALRRDRAIEEALEDRSVEVMSSLAIDLGDRIDALDGALRALRRGQISSAGAR